MLDERPLPLFPDAPRTPPLRPAEPVEIERAVESAIRAGAGCRLTREGDLFLASVSAKLIVERLLAGGFVVALPQPTPPPANGD